MYDYDIISISKTANILTFERMNDFLNPNQIKPVIDHVCKFEEAIAAFEYLSKGDFAKIVIQIS